MILSVNRVTKTFGGLKAISEVSVQVEKGEALGMMGPNGSGKTTLLNCVNGLYKIDSGEIHFEGRPIANLPPHEVARLGVGRTFQIPRTFFEMSVLENMLVPVAHYRDGIASYRKRAYELLQYVDLIDYKDKLAGRLSGGQQKLLEFIRPLMTDPRLLLLDEPFSAVHPVLKEKMHSAIRDLNSKGYTFIIVSHDIPSVMNLCKRVVVLAAGEKIFEGPSERVRGDARVIETYLGG